jgi:hypothetical protein
MIFFSGLIIILLAGSFYLSAPDPIQILVEPSFISGNNLLLERNYLGVVPQFNLRKHDKKLLESGFVESKGIGFEAEPIHRTCKSINSGF